MLDLLTKEELEALTGRDRPSAQKRILDKHGIFWIERGDGTLAVTLHAVHHPSGQTGQDDVEQQLDWSKAS